MSSIISAAAIIVTPRIVFFRVIVLILRLVDFLLPTKLLQFYSTMNVSTYALHMPSAVLTYQQMRLVERKGKESGRTELKEWNGMEWYHAEEDNSKGLVSLVL